MWALSVCRVQKKNAVAPTVTRASAAGEIERRWQSDCRLASLCSDKKNGLMQHLGLQGLRSARVLAAGVISKHSTIPMSKVKTHPRGLAPGHKACLLCHTETQAATQGVHICTAAASLQAHPRGRRVQSTTHSTRRCMQHQHRSMPQH